MRDELTRRRVAARKVLAFLLANPSRWLSWKRFVSLGGACAWRSRISDARKVVEADGGRLEWNGRTRRSAYRYLPYVPLGRDASTPTTQASLF